MEYLFVHKDIFIYIIYFNCTVVIAIDDHIKIFQETVFVFYLFFQISWIVSVTLKSGESTLQMLYLKFSEYVPFSGS